MFAANILSSQTFSCVFHKKWYHITHATLYPAYFVDDVKWRSFRCLWSVLTSLRVNLNTGCSLLLSNLFPGRSFRLRKSGESSKFFWWVKCHILYNSLLAMHKLLVYAQLCRVHILCFGELCYTGPERFAFNLLLRRKKIV